MPETSRSSYSSETPPPLPSKEKQQWQEELRLKIKNLEVERERLLGIGTQEDSGAIEEMSKRIARLKAEFLVGSSRLVDAFGDSDITPLDNNE